MNAPANGRERFLAQALIQLANATLKQVMDRPGAALRLCAVARGHLARVGDRPAMGLAPARVADAIDALEAAIADGRPGADSDPRVRISGLISMAGHKVTVSCLRADGPLCPSDSG